MKRQDLPSAPLEATAFEPTLTEHPHGDFVERRVQMCVRTTAQVDVIGSLSATEARRLVERLTKLLPFIERDSTLYYALPLTMAHESKHVMTQDAYLHDGTTALCGRTLPRNQWYYTPVGAEKIFANTCKRCRAQALQGAMHGQSDS